MAHVHLTHLQTADLQSSLMMLMLMLSWAKRGGLKSSAQYYKKRTSTISSYLCKQGPRSSRTQLLKPH